MLLDFYGIDWEYEPLEFVLERDHRGRATLAFRPDFYLPAYDSYIEVTTLNQKLVTKKNRKARLLQQLHPEVKLKLLYQSDYLQLVRKYGLPETRGQHAQGAPSPVQEGPGALEARAGAGRLLRLVEEPETGSPSSARVAH